VASSRTSAAVREDPAAVLIYAYLFSLWPARAKKD